MKRWMAIVLLTLVGCGDFGPAGPATGMDGAEYRLPGQGSGGLVIVTLASGSAREVARAHGLETDFVYEHVLNGFAATVPIAAQEALLRNPHVARIETDVVVGVAQSVQSGAPWGLDRIDQRDLPLDSRYHYGSSGREVSAYIADTGIRYDHVELAGRAVPGFDVYDKDGSDCHGHGTHVAGTVGGTTYGVAKEARLVSIRVMNCNGAATTSMILAGLDWILDNGSLPGVINMSFAGGGSAALDDAIRRLGEAGFLTVAAAGNSDRDACDLSPARSPNAVTVGAVDRTDTRASWSNWGSCVDLFAPGASITSACHGSSTQTCTKSGTSMAAPHVAGAAALYLASAPTATPHEVMRHLNESSTKGAVRDVKSSNNRLLFSLLDAPEDDGTEPPQPAGPTADFTAECADLACLFTDASTGDVTAWAWQFGDGAGSHEPSPGHAYGQAGSYVVRLTVTDASGATSSRERSVTVETAAPIRLNASVIKQKGLNSVKLVWEGATGHHVDVFRDGDRIATPPNSGVYIDDLDTRGQVSLTYRVCEAGSSTCSDQVPVGS
jgi:subtilisin family serine protease